MTYTTSADFEIPIKALIQAHNLTELRVMAANDRPFLQLIQNLPISGKITIFPNNQILCTETEFKECAFSSQRLLIADFYRSSHQHFQDLMNRKKTLRFGRRSRREGKKGGKNVAFPNFSLH